LGQSIVTEAETLEELRDKISDAIRCHFDENDLPRIIRLHFVKEEVIAL
jgi:predicted RNase H-like HicB family nuclease